MRLLLSGADRPTTARPTTAFSSGMALPARAVLIFHISITLLSYHSRQTQLHLGRHSLERLVYGMALQLVLRVQVPVSLLLRKNEEDGAGWLVVMLTAGMVLVAVLVDASLAGVADLGCLRQYGLPRTRDPDERAALARARTEILVDALLGAVVHHGHVRVHRVEAEPRTASKDIL